MQAPDIEQVRFAIAKLRETERGREALGHLREWIEGDSLTGLDGTSQSALANVIMGLWGPHRGTVADMVRGELTEA